MMKISSLTTNYSIYFQTSWIQIAKIFQNGFFCTRILEEGILCWKICSKCSVFWILNSRILIKVNFYWQVLHRGEYHEPLQISYHHETWKRQFSRYWTDTNRHRKRFQQWRLHRRSKFHRRWAGKTIFMRTTCRWINRPTFFDGWR